MVRIARGIAYYGLPYSALVNVVGAESQAARTDRFEESYLGDWPNLNAFVNHFAADAGWHRRLDQLPESMQPFVHLDLDMLARAARRDLTTVEHPNGLWVFQPRNW